MPPNQVEQTFGLRPVKVTVLGTTQVTQQVFHSFLAGISNRFTPETYDLFTNNCNNFSNEVSKFLLGTGIPDDIINLPQEFLNTPMGQMLRPMLQTTQSQLNDRFEQQGSRMTFGTESGGGASTVQPSSDDQGDGNTGLKSNPKSSPDFNEPNFEGQELMTITVKTSGESKPTSIKVPVHGNVGNLMDAVQFGMKCPKELQRLIYLGKVLKEESESLASLNISEGKTVLLSRRSPTSNDASGTGNNGRSSSSSTPGISTPSGSISMETAMRSLRTAPKQEALTAIQTLVKITDKIISNPNEAKYRSIKKSNEMLKRKVGTVNGGIECLLALGFQDSEDMESFTLVPSASAWNVLTKGKEQLLNLKRSLETNQPPTGQMPNMFGGSPGGMPDMSNVLQAALQNPAMLQGMMANPMVQQMMQSNPMMAAQAQTMMQNPQMLSNALNMMQQNPQMMQQMMSGMTGGGSGMGGMDLQAMGQLFGSMNNSSQGGSSTQTGGSTGNTGRSNTTTDTEAEELAAAIARSLREQ